MQVTVLRSGSSGNAALFASRGTRVLVDAGVGPRTLLRKLRELDPDDETGRIDAIVITHAHSDHVGSAGQLAKKRKIPVYLSEATARHVQLHAGADLRVFSPREAFTIGTLTLTPTPLPHDAAQVSFAIDDGASKAAIATDLGEVPPGLLSHFAGCDTVLLESNHDVEMLRCGPYPDHLKRRILSASGHLSNVQTHELLRALPASVKTVVLMHLSTRNNCPKIARESAEDALRGREIELLVANQDDSLTVESRREAVGQMMLGLG